MTSRTQWRRVAIVVWFALVLIAGSLSRVGTTTEHVAWAQGGPRRRTSQGLGQSVRAGRVAP